MRGKGTPSETLALPDTGNVPLPLEEMGTFPIAKCYCCRSMVMPFITA